MDKMQMLKMELDLMDRFTSKNFSDVKNAEDFEHKLVELYYEIYNELEEEKRKKFWKTFEKDLQFARTCDIL